MTRPSWLAEMLQAERRRGAEGLPRHRGDLRRVDDSATSPPRFLLGFDFHTRTWTT